MSTVIHHSTALAVLHIVLCIPHALFVKHHQHYHKMTLDLHDYLQHAYLCTSQCELPGTPPPPHAYPRDSDI